MPEFLKRTLGVLVLVAVLNSCQSPTTQEIDTAASPTVQLYQPAQALGELFHDVQMSSVFPDSKTFVDCKPRTSPQEILSQYLERKAAGTLDLKAFVNQHFEIPGAAENPPQESPQPMVTHLNTLWSSLTRQADAVSNPGSLLPLPYPYIVPGGRFREIYYWDSYFTMLGLLESGQDSLVISMIRNFAFLIDAHGFIPNGNRTYYLGRSQPPFFSAMVMLWADHHGKDAALPFLSQMKKEHDFWMKGASRLSNENRASERVVLMPDGTVLNRYWDNIPEPRPESYKEDYLLAQRFPQEQREQVYRDLRAGAESGWDYSSRWFSDGQTLDSIITTQIVPVDLNSLMFFLEASIAQLSHYSGDTTQALLFEQQSTARASAIGRYFWDEAMGYFLDYNYIKGQTTSRYSAAGVAPMYFGIATETQASRAAAFLKNNLVFSGGVVSTGADTGQQWDYPNGWAPQQWLAIQGLKNYQFEGLADDISGRWISLTQKVYQSTGKMMEKYNVADLSLDAGGGEYPTQDGFGWTNGVTLALQPQE